MFSTMDLVRVFCCYSVALSHENYMPISAVYTQPDSTRELGVDGDADGVGIQPWLIPSTIYFS